MNHICLNPVHGTTSNCTIAGPSKAKCECPPEFEGDHCEFRKKKIKYTFKKTQCILNYLDSNYFLVFCK